MVGVYVPSKCAVDPGAAGWRSRRTARLICGPFAINEDYQSAGVLETAATTDFECFESGFEQRQVGERVEFDRGYPTHMMAIDGTWRRACKLLDVSETGARMTVEGSIQGLSEPEIQPTPATLRRSAE
jgi:hypothetical protein